MFKSINFLIIIVNIITKSESISKTPLILFNNDDNGIYYDFLEEKEKNHIIITENTTRLFASDYKIKSLDIDIEDHYIVMSSGEYPYGLYLIDYRHKQITDNKSKIQFIKRSIIATKNSQTSVAIDWIHNLVYFFKYNILNVITISNPEISYELTAKEGRDNWKYSSGNIVVNPMEGFIVWTEYNSIDGIAIMRKSNQDGSDQQILVYKDIRLPVCIAIDFNNKQILWIDNELHSLSSIDYSGNNRKILKQSKDLFNDCSSMDIFDGFVYYSSPKDNKISKINITGTDIQEASVDTVVLSDSDIDFVKILVEDKQQQSLDYCLNASCTHICLPSSNQSYRCLCSEVPQLEVCNETKLSYLPPNIPELKQNMSAVSKLVRDKDPLLLFTARKRDIRLAKLPDTQAIHYTDSEFLHKLDHYVSAIDFNSFGNFFVWLKTDSSIYTYLSKTTLFAAPIDQSINNTLNIDNMKPLLNISENSLLKTLAVDWIHNLAYFPLCDAYHSKGIFAVNLSSPETLYQVVPQTTCVTKDIRVDPLESLIFWSEYNEFSGYSNSNSGYSSYGYRSYGYRSVQRSKSQIKRSTQDGQEVEVLVDSQYVRKNSLTLDIMDKRIYWIDLLSYVNTLSSIGYDGTDKKIISSSQNMFEEFSSMDLFDDYIYWTNNEDDTIRKFNKDGLTQTDSIVLQSGVDIDAIKIVHNSRQPNGINRCLNHNCQHICLPQNTKEHNYTCYCPRGQTWNGTSCLYSSSSPSSTYIKQYTTTSTPSRRPMQPKPYLVLDSEPKLLFVVYKEGIYVKPNLYDLNTNYIETIELRTNTDWITELDYNYEQNYLLWLESSVFDGLTLMAAPIDLNNTNGLSIDNQKIIVKKLYNSKRLAFDWIHNLVYLSIPKGIELFSIDDNVYSYDIVTHDEVQGDVAVDPIESIIVWSQWRYYALSNQHLGKICKANQDGSNKVTLYSDAKIPNTLAIDMESKLIYWIDTSLYALYSIDYFGKNFTLVQMSRNLFDGSFSMDVFGDNIFWSNYDKNAILMTDKHGLNASERLVLINAYTDLEGIKVLDNRRQIKGTNRCLNHNCSELCLPINAHQYRCVCSNSRTALMNVCNETKTVTKSESTTTQSEVNTSPVYAHIDHNQYMTNISIKLDTLLNSTTMNPKNNESHHHWIAITLLSIGVNLILISLYIYRKKKMNPLSKYILAKFKNDREEIFLDERLNDDL